MLLAHLIALALWGGTPCAQAAQDAVIAVPRATVREAPYATSPAVIQLPQGTPIKAANQAKGGWYRVLTSDHKMGWIPSQELSFPGQPSGIQMLGPVTKHAEPPDPNQDRIGFSMSYFVHRVKPFSFVGLSGTPSDSVSSPEIALGMHFRIKRKFFLGAQLSTFSFSQSITSGPVSSYSGSSKLLAALLGYAVTDRGHWRGVLWGGAGLGIGSQVALVVNGRTLTSASFFAPAFLGRLDLGYEVASHLILQGSVGMRYMTKSDITLSADLSSDASFNSTFFGGGLAFEL